MYMDLNQLMEIALKVKKDDNERIFCSKYEVLAFVINGTMYAVPWSHSALKVLMDEKFERKDLIIPFGRDLISIEQEAYWNELEIKSKKEKPV